MIDVWIKDRLLDFGFQQVYGFKRGSEKIEILEALKMLDD